MVGIDQFIRFHPRQTFAKRKSHKSIISKGRVLGELLKECHKKNEANVNETLERDLIEIDDH